MQPASTAAWLDQPYKPDSYANEEDGGGDIGDDDGGHMENFNGVDNSASGRSGRRLDDKGNPRVGATPEPEVNTLNVHACLNSKYAFL